MSKEFYLIISCKTLFGRLYHCFNCATYQTIIILAWPLLAPSQIQMGQQSETRKKFDELYSFIQKIQGDSCAEMREFDSLLISYQIWQVCSKEKCLKMNSLFNFFLISCMNWNHCSLAYSLYWYASVIH